MIRFNSFLREKQSASWRTMRKTAGLSHNFEEGSK